MDIHAVRDMDIYYTYIVCNVYFMDIKGICYGPKENLLWILTGLCLDVKWTSNLGVMDVITVH